MRWLLIGVLVLVAGCDDDGLGVPARLPSALTPSPSPPWERGTGDELFFGEMAVDTWNWKDDQLEQVDNLFEHMEALVAEARDAMTTEATARVMQAMPGYSIQVARQSLRQLLSQAMVLLELCDLTEKERSEWDGRFGFGGVARRAAPTDGGVGGADPSGTAGGAADDVGQHCHLSGGVAGAGGGGGPEHVADPTDPAQAGGEPA